MKKVIILKAVKAHHFMGLLNLDMNTNGKKVIISVDNGDRTRQGIGKSSIFDAIYYCLFRKDAFGQRKFDWEPLDGDNNVLDTFDLNIELVFDVNGVEHIFKREIVKERTHRANAVNKHKITTNLYFNGEKLKTEIEFKSKITDILGGEDDFSMYTNAKHLVENLHWEDARKLVTKAIGDVPNDEVIAKFECDNPIFLSNIESKLPSNIIDEQDAIIKASEKTIELSTGSVSELNTLIIENSAVVNNETLEIERNELQAKIDSVKIINDANDKVNTDISNGRIAKFKVEQEIAAANTDGTAIFKSQLKLANADVTIAANAVDVIRTSFNSLNTKELKTKCLVCTAELAADKIVKIKQDHQAKIDATNAEGLAKKQVLDAAKAKVAEIQIQINGVETNDNSAVITGLQSKLGTITAKIAELETKKQEVPNVNDLLNRITEINKVLSRGDIVADMKVKLETRQREITLAEDAKADAQDIIILVGQFIATKSNIITDKVKDLFKNISIKMFDIQKNGLPKETFTILLNGVPYKKVNGAGRVRASIELNQLIQNINGVSYPIFIDEMESINGDLGIVGQLIGLKVSLDPEYSVVIEK